MKRIRLLMEVLALALAIFALFVGLMAGWYYGTWTSAGDWREAWRQGSELRMLLDRFVYLRWIHPDAQYWLSHVDFRDGPITVQGRPPDAPYWSLTWYSTPNTNASLNDASVHYDDSWRYTVLLSEAKGEAENWIEVPEGTGRAVLYLRVYDPTYSHPTRLPTVSQAGRVIAQGGMR